MVNQEKINEWTAALRSGKYKQAIGVLAASQQDTYCCLGLLCVLSGGEVVDNPDLVETGVPGAANPKAIEMGGQKYEGLPPVEMVEALGFDLRDALVVEQSFNALPVWDMHPDWGDVMGQDDEPLQSEHSIAALNDGGFTFEQIADIIDYFGVR